MSDEIYPGIPLEGNIVKYGRFIALKHNMTGRFLTSRSGDCYETGSGQQKAVTAAWEPAPETMFIVLPRLGEERGPEEDVNFGDLIRLKHVESRANLHSHPDFASPLTEQQEVTCFGDDFTTDENDQWVVEQWSFDEAENEEFDVEDPTWYVGRSFYLRHASTGVTLHSHEETFGDDTNEVTGYGNGPDENDRWRVVVE
ncbi:hypothetical protein G6F46_009339 [Rhizopus delemar]|uniref:MIR domain-containing protein n=3 Tax=Rhizopus TaxID=4842 RepID=I1C524_RHIO9|nr:hypothetical protein RO3G_08259 [Rhizopus delemar RA 99-880]KAG1453422.1 hypothetical protein G6F55_008147 [Rhizopus delemar]KAG1538940.1 hypothetical protein G6F51_009454 [Rhizopus arrhizus]KAG1493154.1 hypothetical protein G6F54_008788 [Rhizopus delemar]KAG1508364.1 hypothetical protein G6F53_008246 [Rhizopus delemar]|eukprot:EIE83554.1 hypothetical protein RO3G_08259 [Rhizopus delemar RA 99-880]